MIKQYGIEWSESGLPAENDSIVSWLTDPFYRKIILICYVIYEIIRLVLTISVVYLIVFLSLPLLHMLASNPAENPKIVINNYVFGITIPSNMAAVQVTLIAFVVSVTMAVLIIEILISIYTEFHRPLSYSSLLLTYYVLIGFAQAYSIIKFSEPYDTSEFQTFKDELIESGPSPPALIYYIVYSKFGLNQLENG